MTNLKEIECLAALRSDPEVMPFLKDSITQSIDGYIRLLASEIKRLMGSNFEKEDEIDIYLCLRGPLFYEEGLIIERGRTKKKENVFILRNIERFDEPPLPIPKVDKIEIVPGTNEILKAMSFFERFWPKKEFNPPNIIKIIESFKEIIKNVKSDSETTIEVFLDMDTFNKNCELGLKNILGLIYNLEADYIEYDQGDNSIEFEWLNKNEIENMNPEEIEKYFKRFDID